MHSFTCALPKCSAAFDTNNELWSQMTVAHPGMSNCPASLLGVVGSAAAVLSPRHLEVSPHHPPQAVETGPAGSARRGSEVGPAVANRVGPRSRCVSTADRPRSTPPH